MIKGVIFDLDQTLVDSSISEIYRKSRDWQKVYSLIPSFTLYEGFEIVFKQLKSMHIRSCIVTTSPSRYASKVVSCFKIPCEFIVDYFATPNKKPHPEPMLKALELFSLSPDEVISFGDRKIDIISSESAHIKSAACMWGTTEKDLLLDSPATFVINKPLDITQVIMQLKAF